jgi:transcription elongation factor GreA
MTESVSDYTISPAGLASLETELAELEGSGREEIAARIRTAREWGDLKENGEYHAAKEAQAHLETRILYLRDRILNAVVAESDSGSVVAFGSTVTVRDDARGSEQTFTLAGSTESDVGKGVLSIASPVARALLGAVEGDVVTVVLPSGATRELRVASIA